MIQFQKIKPYKWNIQTGIVRDPQGVAMNGRPPAPVKPNIGMDTDEFTRQVLDLKNKPIHDVHKAIDAHPDITDKPVAKEMATAIHGIVNKPK